MLKRRLQQTKEAGANAPPASPIPLTATGGDSASHAVRATTNSLFLPTPEEKAAEVHVAGTQKRHKGVHTEVLCSLFHHGITRQGDRYYLHPLSVGAIIIDQGTSSSSVDEEGTKATVQSYRINLTPDGPCLYCRAPCKYRYAMPMKQLHGSEKWVIWGNFGSFRCVARVMLDSWCYSSQDQLVLLHKFAQEVYGLDVIKHPELVRPAPPLPVLDVHGGYVDIRTLHDDSFLDPFYHRLLQPCAISYAMMVESQRYDSPPQIGYSNSQTPSGHQVENEDRESTAAAKTPSEVPWQAVGQRMPRNVVDSMMKDVGNLLSPSFEPSPFFHSSEKPTTACSITMAAELAQKAENEKKIHARAPVMSQFSAPPGLITGPQDQPPVSTSTAPSPLTPINRLPVWAKNYLEISDRADVYYVHTHPSTSSSSSTSLCPSAISTPSSVAAVKKFTYADFYRQKTSNTTCSAPSSLSEE